jgi:hypothetical protein
MKSALLITVLALLMVMVGACGGDSGKTAAATSQSSTKTALPVTTASAQPAAPAESLSPVPSSTLSEQPDTATYKKYFSELGIGRMPAGENVSPLELEKNVTLYKVTDQICLYGTIILESQLISTMYDIVSNKVVEQGGLPKPMLGGFAGWEPMPVPAGKYEYKVYIGDVLVAIFPFEVTE